MTTGCGQLAARAHSLISTAAACVEMAARPFAPIVLDLNYKAKAQSPRQMSGSDGGMLEPPKMPGSASQGMKAQPKRTRMSYDYLTALQESGEFGLRQPQPPSQSHPPAPPSAVGTSGPKGLAAPPWTPSSRPQSATPQDPSPKKLEQQKQDVPKAEMATERADKTATANVFSMSHRAREADTKLQLFYESNLRTFQACESLLRDASEMICNINVRAHVQQAKIVSLFDPTLQEELAKAREASQAV